MCAQCASQRLALGAGLARDDRRANHQFAEMKSAVGSAAGAGKRQHVGRLVACVGTARSSCGCAPCRRRESTAPSAAGPVRSAAAAQRLSSRRPGTQGLRAA